MIKVLIAASIIFVAVFSFGLNADKIATGQMASDLENISNNLLSGLEILGLNDEEQDIDAQAVVTNANVDFKFDVITANPDSPEAHFLNVVSECSFHSNESIEEPTCVICKLLNSTGDSVGTGRTELPGGYVGSENIPIAISDVEFEGQNSVFSVVGVELSVCDVSQGCSVAFWKSNQLAWNDIPVPQSTPFRLAFFGPNDTETFEIMLLNGTSVSNPTLLDALSANATKGGINKLVPQAVAALLNSQHPTIDFNLTSDEVVISFNAPFSTPDDPIDDEELAAILLTYNALVCPLQNNGVNLAGNNGAGGPPE